MLGSIRLGILGEQTQHGWEEGRAVSVLPTQTLCFASGVLPFLSHSVPAVNAGVVVLSPAGEDGSDDDGDGGDGDSDAEGARAHDCKLPLQASALPGAVGGLEHATLSVILSVALSALCVEGG